MRSVQNAESETSAECGKCAGCGMQEARLSGMQKARLSAEHGGGKSEGN